MRSSKDLLVASREYAHENWWLSWWHFWSTLFLLISLLVVAASPLNLTVRLLASFLVALVWVRLFIIFHDFQHHAILKNSKLAGAILWLYGLLTLSPTSVWNRSHTHHHKHNSKNVEVNIGSFPVMTRECYQAATTKQRTLYLVSRHPVTLLLGYFTIFAWGMCLSQFFRHPVRHFDCMLSILIHATLVASLTVVFGPTTMLLTTLLPLFAACAIGSYLFYAQHNFPDAKLKPASEWNHVDAALESSSFTKMGPILNWFTGNIGYHHVHHMNALIPFYRLPEAMNALVELQSPGVTSLSLRDIRACLRLKFWDPVGNCFVGLKESAAEANEPLPHV